MVKVGRLPLWVALVSWCAMLALVGLVTAYSVPLHAAFWLRMLPWLLARTSGLAAFVLLTLIVVLGILLSHPRNLVEWKFSKIIIVWHRYLTVLTFGLVALHIGAIIADSYAKVGLLGAAIPGLSVYRTWPVALGTITLYGMIVLTATAANPKWLGGARWLTVHRFSIAVFVVAWMHGVLAGTDTLAFTPLYILAGGAVGFAYAGRWWIDRTLPPRPDPGPARVAPLERPDGTSAIPGGTSS
ncbi:MAG: ferric reductase-like transmembrane domain-containing protein [Sulfobacillus sp.]